MTTQSNLTTNKNYLSQLGFQFHIKRLENVSFFVTAANVPGISSSPPSMATPFKTLHLAPDKLSYDDFVITFLVDEDMKNWIEVYNWMIGLGFPKEFPQRANLQAGDGLYSDATLTILNSNKKPNIEISFQDLQPFALSSIDMKSTDADVDNIQATVSFKYKLYDIRSLNS